MHQIENIRREHILEAIARVDREDVPNGRNYRVWALWYNNEHYPCKLVVSWAHEVLTGQEIDNDPAVFQTDKARKCLEELGFEVVRVTGNQEA